MVCVNTLKIFRKPFVLWLVKALRQVYGEAASVGGVPLASAT